MLPTALLITNPPPALSQTETKVKKAGLTIAEKKSLKAATGVKPTGAVIKAAVAAKKESKKLDQLQKEQAKLSAKLELQAAKLKAKQMVGEVLLKQKMGPKGSKAKTK